MYTRYHVWQEPDIASASETLWENVIVTKFPAIDIRLLLKDYGWKPNPTDENLTILYEGRYEVFYREISTTPWIKFATVISERASTNVGYVYEDASVALGLSPEKIYELKIVAVDGEKFTNWGGTLEGITSGGVFYTDMRMRMIRPIEVGAWDDIAVPDVAVLGKEYIDLFAYDYLFSFSAVPEMFGITFMEIFDSLSIEETPRMQVNLVLGDHGNVYEAFNGIVEVIMTTWEGPNNLWSPVEDLTVEENLEIYEFPYGIPEWDNILVDEWFDIAMSTMEIYPGEDVSITDWADIIAGFYNTPTLFENLTAQDEL